MMTDVTINLSNIHKAVNHKRLLKLQSVQLYEDDRLSNTRKICIIQLLQRLSVIISAILQIYLNR